MPTQKRSSLQALSLAVASTLAPLAILTGCAAGNPATTSLPIVTYGLQITGQVMGGQQPIGGATITIYQTGTSGYGAGATAIATTTSTAVNNSALGKAGNFNVTIPTVSCPAGPYFYVTATGGDPSGTTASNYNPQIVLVSLFDACTGGAATPTFVAINEVTTAAAANALRAFTTDSSGVVNIGAPSSNAQGLRDAVANSALLVNPQTGLANASTSTMYMPSATLNTLANIAATCVNSSQTAAVTSGAGTPTTSCTGLFSNASLPAAPTDTFQALLNIATYPGNNVQALTGLPTGTVPFQCPSSCPLASGTTNASQTSVINDLSIGIVYPQATLGALSNTPVGLTIDNSDNVIVTGGSNGTTISSVNYLGEIPSSSVGGGYGVTAGTAGSGTTDTPTDGTNTLRYAVFDGNGNLFISNKSASGAGAVEVPTGSGFSGAVALPTFTTLSAGTGTSSLDPNDYDVTVDAGGNLWTASYGAQGNCYPAGTANKAGVLCEYVEYVKPTPANGFTSYTPTDVFNNTQVSDATVRSIAADAVSTSPGVGTIWSANYGNFSNVKTAPGEYGSTVSALLPNGTLNVINVGAANDSPFAVVTDAVGGAYVTTAATLAASNLYYVPQATANGASITAQVSTSGQSNFPNIPTVSSAPANTTAGASTPNAGGFNGPGNDVVDGAGNVWVGNAGFGTAVEYSPASKAYLSPYYGFAPAFSVPATTSSITAFSKASGSGAVTLTASNSFSAGQTVTISGLATPGPNGTYVVLAAGLNATQFEVSNAATTTAGATQTGSALSTAYQTLFTCTSSTSSCAPGPSPLIPSNNPIAVDRTGSVWTMDGKGTVLEILGLAAPTSPVNAKGQTGVLP